MQNQHTLNTLGPPLSGWRGVFPSVWDALCACRALAGSVSLMDGHGRGVGGGKGERFWGKEEGGGGGGKHRDTATDKTLFRFHWDD